MKVWNTLKTTYKVSDFISWQREGTLRLNPDFQRRPVWQPGAKSYLIDTIIRGLPIPIIFLRDQKSSMTTFAPQRDVVDGQQRLRTVISFVAPELLQDFDTTRDRFVLSKHHSTEYQGKSFRELPEDVRNRILDYQFTVNVFASDTDDREVKQVFQRMNATGYRLNDQELRNAEFFGAFKTIVESLATEQLNRWRSWKVFTPQALSRMNEVELSSEFVIVMLQGVSEKTDKVISGVYKKYDESFKQGPEVAKRFRAVFQFIDDNMAEVVSTTFRKRTMCYALLASIYHLQFGIHSSLTPVKPKRIASRKLNALIDAGRRVADKTAPRSIVEAATRGTTHVKERKRLIGYLVRRMMK